jgi:hypothetical protein
MNGVLMNLEVHPRVVGMLLLMLAGLNVLLPRRFGWGTELAKLSLLTRQIFIVHCVFIFLVLVMMGVLSAVFAPLLMGRTPLATVVLSGLTVFWVVRLLMQFFFYSPKLWQGNRFNTVMHIVFSCVWIYVSTVYVAALMGSVR